MANLKWKSIDLNIDAIHEWPANPRKLTEKGLADLEKSIKEFGVATTLTVAQVEGKGQELWICGGHGRKVVLKKKNINLVPCSIPDRALTLKEFERLNVRLNKNIAGEFDFELLTETFEIGELLDLGFTNHEFLIGPILEAEEEELDLSSDDKEYLITIECKDELERSDFLDEFKTREIKCKVVY